MPSPFYGTTAKYALRKLLGTSNGSDIDAGFDALATDVENAFAGYKSGTNAARLAATNIDGLLWRETDTAGLPLYLGTGTVWVQLTPSRGATAIAASESRTSTSFGTLTTPDQVANVILPTNGLLAIWYWATWSATNTANAAIFLNSNQAQIAAQTTAPATQSAANSNANVARPLATSYQGLNSDPYVQIYTSDVTTGQILGSGNASGIGGPVYLFAAAGTYTVSIQFKVGSGTVTVANRKLWVQALSFA